MRIIFRILFFPFLAAIFLIVHLFAYLKTIWNLATKGGEAIVYSDNCNVESIKQMHDDLKKLIIKSEHSQSDGLVKIKIHDDLP